MTLHVQNVHRLLTHVSAVALIAVVFHSFVNGFLR